MSKEKLWASLILLALLESNAGIVALSSGVPATLTPMVIYEDVTDKPIDDVLNELRLLNPQFISRGYFKWYAKPEDMVTLADRIRRIKAVLPDVIFQAGIAVGAIRADYLLADGSSIDPTTFDSMVLHDPKGNQVEHGYQMRVADPVSPALREYVMGWIKKMIDAGADAIFFDTVYLPALLRIVNFNEDRDKVLSEYGGYWKLIHDATKKYGRSKGKEILVNTIQPKRVALEIVHPYQDIVFVPLDKEDVDNFSYGGNEAWNRIKENTFKSLGKQVPIVMQFDWGFTSESPLGKFASLSTSDQIRYLEILRDGAEANGIIFAWQVHGGNVGGGRGKYDAKSYGTYDAIKTLIGGGIPSKTAPDKLQYIYHNLISIVGVVVIIVVAIVLLLRKRRSRMQQLHRSARAQA